MKKLFIFIITFLYTTSCGKEQPSKDGTEIKYVVGSHNPIKDVDYSKKDYVLKFTNDSKYYSNTGNQLDWSKLFGVLYFNGHSIRWVWSYDPSINKFLIGWYIHDGTKKPKYQQVCEIGIGQRIRLKIDDSTYSNYYMYYQIEGYSMQLAIPPKNHNSSKFGIHNGWFGGDDTQKCSYIVYSGF